MRAMKRKIVPTLVAHLRRALARTMNHFAGKTTPFSRFQGTSRFGHAATTGALCPDVKRAILLLAPVLMLVNLANAQRGPQDTWYQEKEIPMPAMPGLNGPYDVTVAPDGKLYVSDELNDRISIWDANGTFLKAFSGYGSGDGQLSNPHSIAFHGGETFVVDTYNHRIQVFDANGTFKRKWGSYGSGDGQFNTPWGVAIHTDGNGTEVFVTERGTHRVQVFDLNGNFLRKWGSYGGGNGQFYYPQGIAVSADATVYVGSTQHSKVKVFDRNGTYLRSFGTGNYAVDLSWIGNRLAVSTGDNGHRVRTYETNGTLVTTIGNGSAGSGPAELNTPWFIGEGADGKLLVSDHANHRIQVFEANGTHAGSFGQYGTTAFTPKDLLRLDDGNFLVSDASGDRVLEMDENGTLIKVLANKGNGDGEVQDPWQMTLGPNGLVYVVERANNRVSVLDRNGSFVRKWGSPGAGDGSFDIPEGIAISDNGEVFVSELGNDRIQVFDLNGTFLRKWGSYGTGEGKFREPCQLALNAEGELLVTDYTNNRIQIFDRNGAFLRKWSTSFKPSRIKLTPDGLVLLSGHSSSQFQVREMDGTWLKSISVNGFSHAPMAAHPKGGFFAFHELTKLRRWQNTYRVLRPKTAKEMPLPEVISVTQPQGTNHVSVTYRIHDADSPQVSAALLGFVDGGNDLHKVIVPETFVGSVTGQLDDNVSTGQTHTVTWNAEADWKVGYGEMAMEILAKDDRNLLNLHFLTLPASDNNASTLQISRSPITEGDLLDLWYWLVASGDSEVAFSNGIVHQPETAGAQTFAPASLPNLKLWLDATDLDGNGQADSLVQDTPVSIWVDKAGGDHNATQSNEAKYPVHKANSRNGKPSVFFDNSNDGLATSLNLSSPFTVAVVFNSVSSSGSRRALQGSSNWLIGPYQGRVKYYSAGSWISTGVPQVANRYYLAIASNSGSESTFWIDGFDYTTDSTRLGTPGTLHLGASGHQTSHTLNGHVAEVFAFDAAISAENRTNLSKYLAEKWALAYAPTPYASGSASTTAGKAYLLNRMNLREASAAEVTRAKEASTPGIINQFTPSFKVGPDERPVKVNEHGFDTGATSGFWVVPIPQ